MELLSTFPLIVLMFLSSNIEGINSKKILMLPILHTSHVNFFGVAGEALAEHGHDVTIITHPRNKKVLNRPSLTILYTQDKEVAIDSEKFQKSIFQLSLSGASKMLGTMSQMFNDFCESILGDDMIMAKLKDANFDLVIVEGDAPAFCLYIVAYKLGVPHMSMAAVMDPWNQRVSSLPSVEPLPITPKTNDMGFFNRVENSILFIGFHCVAPWLVAQSQNYMVSKYVPEKPAIDVRELHSQSQLWLVNWEPYILDYPRVSTPYYHYVGGIGTTPPKPLPRELETFVQGNSNGCIVLTFGSAIRIIPIPVMKKFLEAFRKIDLNVIITNKGETLEDIPPNVRIQTWLPQNDILGHPNTKLFITHGGNNGQLEALYHGVPQIVFPVAGDQEYNAVRVEKKGFGLHMNLKDFTAEQLHKNIREMLDNKKYKEKAMRASQIFRSLPSPKDNIIFWVDHILKFGGDHLRPSYLNMPLYQFFMLDVAAFFIVIVIVIVYIIKVICRCCCRLCKKTNKDKKD